MALFEGFAEERPSSKSPGAILRYGDLARHMLLRYKAVAIALYRAANRYTDSDKAYVVVNPDVKAWVREGDEVLVMLPKDGAERVDADKATGTGFKASRETTRENY